MKKYIIYIYTTMRNYKGCGIKKNKSDRVASALASITNLLDNFEEDGEANKKNKNNELVLTKTIKKVIAHNKKMSLKPINTHVLISK